MKKVMKRIVALALVLTMALSTVIVSSAASKKAGKVTVNATGVSVKSKTITIQKKKSVTLGVAAKKVKVKASKKGIVKVAVSKKAKTIKVTGKKAGKTKLTISKKGYKTVKVTVKVAKKVTAVKATPASANVAVAASTVVKANKTAKVAKASKNIAVKTSKKNVTVTGVAEGTASFYVYDKANAANYKKVNVVVTAAAVETKKNADGTVTATIPANVTALTVKTPAGNTLTLDGEELAELTKAIADAKVADTFKAKTATVGAKVTIAGKEATVKVAGETVTYAGKDYTVKVDDAAKKATINGKTIAWTYDAATGYTVTANEKAGYTFAVAGVAK